MTELGKIEPERITEEEYQRRMAEASGEEAAAVASEKIRISKILHFIPGVLLIACLCLAGADKEHAIGYLIASCIILGVFYGTQVVRAAKIARAGSNIMAKKALRACSKAPSFLTLSCIFGVPSILIATVDIPIIRAFRKVLKGLKLAGKAAEVLTK